MLFCILQNSSVSFLNTLDSFQAFSIRCNESIKAMTHIRITKQKDTITIASKHIVHEIKLLRNLNNLIILHQHATSERKWGTQNGSRSSMEAFFNGLVMLSAPEGRWLQAKNKTVHANGKPVFSPCVYCSALGGYYFNAWYSPVSAMTTPRMASKTLICLLVINRLLLSLKSHPE